MILQAITLVTVGFACWAIACLINAFGRFTVSTQDAINTITEQLGKARVELVNRINEVQAQLEAAGVAEVVDLSSLTAAAQALDDVVPDVAVDVVPDAEPAA